MTTPQDPFRESTGLYVLGALAPDERRAFEAHLATCPDCQAEVRVLRPVVDAISLSVMPNEPPTELRQRVLRAAAAARRPLVASPVTEGSSIGTTAVAQVSHRPPAISAGWLAAAAAAVLAAAVSMYAMTLRSRLEAVEVRLSDAIGRLADSQQQLQAALRETGAVRASLALLTAPDSVELRLAGQAPAPGARARVFLSRSRGLLFAGTNLPLIPGDRTYQLWFLTPGAPVSAGLLRPDAQGNVTTAFDIAPDAPTPTGLALSLEPEGGVPSPTGAIYMVTQ